MSECKIVVTDLPDSQKKDVHFMRIIHIIGVQSEAIVMLTIIKHLLVRSW